MVKTRQLYFEVELTFELMNLLIKLFFLDSTRDITESETFIVWLGFLQAVDFL